MKLLLQVLTNQDEFNEKFLYSRYFFFFDVMNVEDKHSFVYSLKQTQNDGSSKILMGPFHFQSNVHTYVKQLQFQRLQNKADLKIITFGDHDRTGEDLYKALGKEKPDLFILLGDYSYDVQDDLGVRGDDYFHWMQTHFQETPMILTPGNHENYLNTEFFNNRFMMPGTRRPVDNNLFAIQTHFLQVISFNFDYQIINPSIGDFIELLFEKTMTRFKARKDKHFSIFMSHRPLHCQYSYADCVKLANDFQPLEEHLQSIKIHLNLWGHVHRYERLKAIFQHKVSQFSNMFSLIVGTGGNKEDEKESVAAFSKNNDPSDDAIVSDKKGYAKLIINSSQLYSKFICASSGEIVDEHTIFSDNKSPNFPIFMWLFFGLLILFFLLVVFCSISI